MPGLSLNGVRAFESAARQRSFKAAAEELGVTPSAVSHQVRLLEDSVGSRLFARRHNAVELTPEGARFFNDISPAISAIAGRGWRCSATPARSWCGCPARSAAAG